MNLNHTPPQEVTMANVEKTMQAMEINGYSVFETEGASAALHMQCLQHIQEVFARRQSGHR